MEELLRSLKAERQSVWAQGKVVLNRLNTNPTAADRREFSTLESDLEKLDERIEGLTEKLDREALADTARGRFESFIRPAADARGMSSDLARFLNGTTDSLTIDTRAYTVDVDKKSGAWNVKNALSTSGDTSIVPTSFSSKLVEHLVELSSIRQAGPRMFRTTGGEALVVPKTLTHASATIVTEGGTIPTSDPTFGQATLLSYKYGDMVSVSTELLQDSGLVGPDLEDYLAASFAEAIVNGSGQHFVTGDGSSKPLGLIVGGSVGVSGTASGGIPTGDEIIELFYDLPRRYRESSSWFMSDDAAFRVRTAKNSNGDYLWAQGLNGAPDTLLGRPVITDPYMPSAGTSATSIAIARFDLAYALREAGQLRIDRSDQFAFDTDESVFRVLQRLDGQPLDPNAIRVYVGGTAA